MQNPFGSLIPPKKLFSCNANGEYFYQYIKKHFCVDKSPLCGATGTFCFFTLWLTLPIGFKARMDIYHVHNDNQSQFWPGQGTKHEPFACGASASTAPRWAAIPINFLSNVPK